VLAVTIRADGCIAGAAQKSLAVYTLQVGIGDIRVTGAASRANVGAVDKRVRVAVLQYAMAAVAVVAAGPAIAIVHGVCMHTVAIGMP